MQTYHLPENQAIVVDDVCFYKKTSVYQLQRTFSIEVYGLRPPFLPPPGCGGYYVLCLSDTRTRFRIALCTTNEPIPRK